MKRFMLILVMLLAMIGCVPAQADAHTAHYLCGQTACTHAGTAHSGAAPQWIAWDGGAFASGSTVYCYLEDDVSVSTTIKLQSGTHVYLCLNGHDVIQTGTGNVFSVAGVSNNPASLTICDCSAQGGSVRHSTWGTNGHGVSLNINNTLNLYGGTITNNYTGVYTAGSSAKINIYGGAVDSNEEYGVHLSASSSTLTMYGGTISNMQNAQGVYISDTAHMSMSGGVITGNNGGIRVNGYNATVSMTGGEIRYNSAENGGGVLLEKGTFTLQGGKITGNTAERGGGVYASGGTFNHKSGSIEKNELSAAGDYGGGVYLGGGQYTLSGGSIADNRAMVSGGGVYRTSSGNLTIEGGEITGNNARQTAGGVYANGLYISSDGARIIGNSVGGWYSSSEVTQERASNIYLPSSGQRVELAPSMDTGEFGVTCAGVSRYPHPFVHFSGSSLYKMDQAHLALFTPDDRTLTTVIDAGSPYYGSLTQKETHIHKACGTAADASCTHAQSAHTGTVSWTPWDGTYIPRLSSGTTYLYLTQDNADAATINVENGQTLYLCLNGHDFIRTDDGQTAVTIGAGGELILCDCSAEGEQGMMSTNYAARAGLISNYGTFTMYGGSLANSSKPAITCANGNPTVNLYGGSITGHKGGYAGTGNGCGVYMRFGVLNMYGGSITNNTASNTNGQGGGVWLGDTLYGVTMNLYGGTISGNKLTGSASEGGGIYVSPKSVLYVYGGTVTGNTAAAGGGVQMDRLSNSGSSLTMQGNVTITGNTGGNLNLHSSFMRTGEVTGSVGLTLPAAPTETQPVNFASNASGMTDAELARFTSDQGYTDKRVQNGFAQFYVKPTKRELTVSVNPEEGGTVTGAGSYAAGEAVELSASPAPGYRFDSWEVLDGSLTLTNEQKQAPDLDITMPGGALSLKANFVKRITVKAEIMGYTSKGVIQVAGRTDARTHEFEVDYGTEVTLTAACETGYHLAAWRQTGKGQVSTSAAYTFTATQDVQLQAHIAANTYAYTIKVSPEGSGAAKDVEKNAASGSHPYGYSGTLKAEAAEDYSFLRWEITKGEGELESPVTAETEYTVGMSDIEITAVFAKAHSHAVCGESVAESSCGMDNHSGHNADHVFLPWDGTTELDFDSGEVFIYLVDDVTTDSIITVPAGAALHLCLNGKMLSSGAVNAIDATSHNNTVTLCDCIGTDADTWGAITRKEGTFGRAIFSRGLLEIYGGSISGHDTTGLKYADMSGAGVMCGPNATFILYNGSITQNKANTGGGGVYMHAWNPAENGNFIMHNGLISRNSVDGDGGGVILHGAHMIMNGGLITYNSATETGGGLRNAGMLTINDGGISDNTAGAVGGGIFYQGSTTMNGGYIARNKAGQYGGGINGPLSVQGDAAVMTNVSGTSGTQKNDNIYLPAGQMITIIGDLTRTVGGSIEVLGITVAEEPTTVSPVPYVRRANGSVKPDDLNRTFADAVLNDASKAEVYDKRINADGNGEFAPKTYEVTAVNAQLDGGSTSGSFAKGEDVSVTAVVPQGQTFSGWTAEGVTLNDEQKAGATLEFTMPGNAVTVTAKITPIEYMIKWKNDDETELYSGKVAYGQKPVYPGAVPEKAATAEHSYVFAGWYPDPVPVTGEAEYTATYTTSTNSYKVTWKDEAGETVYSEDVPYGADAQNIPAVPEKTGHKGEWSHNGRNITDITVITPVYTVNQYTITFDTDGGSGIEPITQDYGTPLTVPADPAKEGFVFAGWMPELPETMPATNMKLTARWEPVVPETYSVVVTTIGHGAAHANPSSGVEGTMIVVEAVPETGYALTKLMHNGEDVTAQVENNRYVFSLSAENAAIEATFDAIPAAVYTVTFYANGGEGAMQPQKFTEGVAQALTLNAFSRDGYTFESWNTHSDGSGISYEDGAVGMLEQDIGLYAQWRKNPHVHVWDEDNWSSDDTHHWHECTQDDCDITDDEEKGGYGRHEYVNGRCICGRRIGEDPHAVTLDVVPQILELIAGESSMLEAVVTPREIGSCTVIWSSGDESVAVVDENGLVTAVGCGTVTITATLCGENIPLNMVIADTCEVTVTAPEVEIPDTGDDSRMMLYATLFAWSAAGLAVMMKKRRIG